MAHHLYSAFVPSIKGSRLCRRMGPVGGGKLSCRTTASRLAASPSLPCSVFRGSRCSLREPLLRCSRRRTRSMKSPQPYGMGMQTKHYRPCPRFLMSIFSSSHPRHTSLAVPGRFWDLHGNMLKGNDLQLRGPGNKATSTVEAELFLYYIVRQEDL